MARGGNVVCNVRHATQEDVMEDGLKQKRKDDISTNNKALLGSENQKLTMLTVNVVEPQSKGENRV